MSTNLVILQGNLGADPEIRYYPDGTPNATFSVATNAKWKNKQGETVEHTEWHRCVTKGRTAEIAQEYLKSGDPVFLQGANRTRKWDDKEGVTRYTTEVVITRLQLMSAGKGKASAPPSGMAPPLDDDDGMDGSQL